MTVKPSLDHAADLASAPITPEVRQILDHFVLNNVASHLLRRAHFAAEEAFAQEFSAENLTPRQKAALVTVYQQPGLNQNALADHLCMDRNTVAEMVKRLTQRNLLRRISAQDDQRAYQIFVTTQGAALLNAVMARDALLEQRVFARLPEEYRPLFMKCLRLLVAPAASLPP